MYFQYFIIMPKISFSVSSYSWGYKRVFEQYAHALHEKYPDLAVEGDNYPPPATRALLAQGLSIFKLVLIVLVLLGQDPFPHLNMETPSIFTWATQNKVSVCTFKNIHVCVCQRRKAYFRKFYKCISLQESLWLVDCLYLNLNDFKPLFSLLSMVLFGNKRLCWLTLLFLNYF